MADPGPGPAAPGDVVAVRLVALAAALRARDVTAGPGEVVLAARALTAVDAGSRAESRRALRAVFTSRRPDLAPFDEAFTEVFGAAAADRPAPEPAVDLGAGATLALPRFGDPDRHELPADLDPVPVPAAASDVELLHDKDFAAYSDRDRALARGVLQQLARRGPTRLGRRTRVAPRREHGRPDVPGTLRASLRTGGEPVRLVRRAPLPVPRPLVLLVDVSGSMAPYARMLLQYAQAAAAARPRVQVFAFGTRLTELTRELHGRDPDAALARAADAVVDWSGGTRIGAALGTLQRTYGRRLGRGAVVVILSDGWDRGDPDVLAAELARLRRSAHRVIWLNPLKASPGYEPLARGMAAALPHTDHFLAGHSLRSLSELAELLAEGLDGPRGEVPRATAPTMHRGLTP
ncbi:VWA domain-containing protein [Paraconexibacter antarcticus]|uniref:VWA domain-containing protein n=1 Tax=Paraconexibacter antarcticus TaxID=2949664 RepID=A0ABY5DN35_9ACTN|nr:VWA domain-containing protein [Paraconexibacter antarcticus]UTI63425.1 VWA domain-containing protein [Paraconexibacter antarcticus]